MMPRFDPRAAQIRLEGKSAVEGVEQTARDRHFSSGGGRPRRAAREAVLLHEERKVNPLSLPAFLFVRTVGGLLSLSRASARSCKRCRLTFLLGDGLNQDFLAHSHNSELGFGYADKTECAWAVVYRGLILSSGISLRVPTFSLGCIPQPPHPTVPHPSWIFLRTSMSIGFQADRSVVGINEPVGVTVVARNDSSVAVKSALIELVQETRFWAQGSDDCSTRTLASVEVPITDLAPAEAGGHRGRSSSAIADAARADLEQQLASGAGSRHEILVPDKTTITFRSMTIDVRHLLTVKLKTAGCVDSPDVWIPVLIQPGSRPGPSSTVPEAEIGTFAPSSAEAASLVGVNRVSVPPSAVRLDYQYELPAKSGPAKRQW